MILYDANAPGPNPVTVRLFVAERSGLSFDVATVDLANLANRAKEYRTTVNARGEVPALRLDDGRVITEITAICGYFDEIANGGRKLFGEAPEERAEIQMWTRRVDMEICQPFVTWWRGTDAGESLFHSIGSSAKRACRGNDPSERLKQFSATNCPTAHRRLDDFSRREYFHTFSKTQ